MSTQLLLGDCLERLRELADNSVHSVITDPPYGLSKEPDIAEVMRHWINGDRYEHKSSGFMGKSWDSFVPGPEYWREVFRVLKPGGHVVVFAGTRTQDLMTVAMRFAGFEIRDTLQWIYGSGFPKSLNVGKALREHAPDAAKQWEGWGTALKPAHEPVILARKPLSSSTVAMNVQEHGTGAINIDACRVSFASSADERESKTKNQHAAFGSGPMTNDIYGVYTKDRDNYNPPGRWPANLLLTHSASCKQTGAKKVKGTGGGWNGLGGDEARDVYGKGWHPDGMSRQSSEGHEDVPVYDCTEDCPVRALDQQSGERPSGSGIKRPAGSRASTNIPVGVAVSRYDNPGIGGDTGGASRFFPQLNFDREYDAPFLYSAKASRRERNEGVEGLPAKKRNATAFDGSGGVAVRIGEDGKRTPKAVPAPESNFHPTVKPVALMRWLCRLITPPSGTALDPFLGSGTTGVAAKLEGFSFIGIEREAEYMQIAGARIAHAAAPKPANSPDQPPLFQAA